MKENKILLCEEDPTEKELYEAMIITAQEKSPGNDGLTKDFYKSFCEDLKDIFTSFAKAKKCKKEFTSSKKQAVIKVIKKKVRDKRFTKNWHQVSFLTIDYKIVSKALATRLKEYFLL